MLDGREDKKKQVVLQVTVCCSKKKTPRLSSGLSSLYQSLYNIETAQHLKSRAPTHTEFNVCGSEGQSTNSHSFNIHSFIQEVFWSIYLCINSARCQCGRFSCYSCLFLHQIVPTNCLFSSILSNPHSMKNKGISKNY